MLRLLVGLTCIAASAPWASAQVLQLPSMHTFEVQTSVMVPDSGGMSLAGASRAAMASSTRGVPGWGPLGRNAASSRIAGASGMMVRATIIDHEELDRRTLGAATGRRATDSRTDADAARISSARSAPAGSVAAIKRELAEEEAAAESRAAAHLSTALKLEREGDVRLARSYYLRAAHTSTGEVKQRALERLASLPGSAR
jgi:hypothetical protein